MNRIRVVVTGLGVVSPQGNTISDLTKQVFNGVSAVKKIVCPFYEQLTCKIAAQPNFDPSLHFQKNVYTNLDPIAQMALYSSNMAIEDANLDMSKVSKNKTGVYVGTGMGGAHSIDDGYVSLYKEGHKRIKPFTVLMSMYNSAAAAIASHHKITGTNNTYSTACSSSAIAIGAAVKDIRHGYTEVAIASGTDAILSYGSIRAWEAVRTLAKEDEKDISASCKPFSANRTGLVIGEGAATVVLESYEHAKLRGAKIYGEVIGFGAANDCSHITIPTIEGQASSMQAALDDAEIEPTLIQYINAHGTGTKFNDKAETGAIKKVFGDHAYNLSVSSTKSMHGHLMGAASCLELIISLLALKENKLPPTINLEVPDPDCNLDYVPIAREVENLEYVMSNSFAFGGTGAALILKKI
jgi:3-oxoacyl-[acyl-carrier-protein] synthase II